MARDVIYLGQGITKDCIVGDREMNRYAIFNGLERPRRIDSNLNVTILGVTLGATPTAAVDAGAGNLATGWYAWRIAYASAIYTRPVPVLDGSGNYTRGNLSAASVVLNVGAGRSVNVTAPTINQDGITHVLLYRSLVGATQAEAEAGPFYYVAQGYNTGATVTILDNVADALVGVVAEDDNFPPNAHRYAVTADSYVFTGGSFPIGTGLTCTVVNGSATVTLDEGASAFYDGIIGWRFKIYGDTTGGADGGGLYYANYVSANTLQLIDADGNVLAYNSSAGGSGKLFLTYLPGNVLRWCKKGEPEACPAENLITFEGEILGLIQIPNQSLLLVCTDEPTMWVLDLNIIGTTSFKTNKTLISTEHTATSHYSLVAVEGRIRAIDASKNCIIQCDGTSVVDVSSGSVPKIFEYLDDDINNIRLWHCAYDQRQKLFGAFVTFQGAQRMIDFCIGQNLHTGGWFFHLEKDLLSTGKYIHPDTGASMILGGTEGPGQGLGGVWGRIWAPNIYSEWIPLNTLTYGEITGVTDANTFQVDTSGGSLATSGSGLEGRWVLVCDENGEYAQVGYIYTNTANQITVNRVINGMMFDQFSPVPQIGWKFYLGLIECRWGPKRFDFGDPDTLKKIWEVWCTVHGHNEDDPPFIRLFRGFENTYDVQLDLSERIYLDATQNQSLINKTSHKLEPVARWGIAWYDRSYGPTVLHSMTIVFNSLDATMRKKE